MRVKPVVSPDRIAVIGPPPASRPVPKPLDHPENLWHEYDYAQAAPVGGLYENRHVRVLHVEGPLTESIRPPHPEAAPDSMQTIPVDQNRATFTIEKQWPEQGSPSSRFAGLRFRGRPFTPRGGVGRARRPAQEGCAGADGAFEFRLPLSRRSSRRGDRSVELGSRLSGLPGGSAATRDRALSMPAPPIRKVLSGAAPGSVP